ncbi:Alpha-L-fucosidase [Metarhizium acridum CQMa 102]|uniref:alpha-L-fucosidase n=1 Tax=Metarhizium acridum (strain CQMa 102) TaxID=655827 RepID=E9EHC7_METAQ|nr:Alpha-L-fucosidase [Metarhizium acridum CQMa 102]EFY84685.1 Alpha-L-fucosidase [Metarhizium acridum CQMa 102]
MPSLGLITLLFFVSGVIRASGRSRGWRPPFKPRYRISPIDGSKIALPTKEQLAFQDREIGALIHFDVATWLSIDGCNSDPSLVPNASLFDPTLINTNQWFDSVTSLGVKYAALAVKHYCGFASWPSQVTFPTRHGNQRIRYNYTTTDSPLDGLDVAKEFVDSAREYNVGHGSYYSVVVNNFLNAQKSRVRTSKLSPGRVGITNATCNQIVLDQLSEL